MKDSKDAITYFIAFCVEQYKNAKNLSGQEAFDRLDQYGVLAYLSENYEVLHTQSAQWILEDIEEFIDNTRHYLKPTN